MKPFIPFLTLLGLMAILWWMRKGHGGRLGQAVRDSDHAAWRWAVEEKEAELRALRDSEPR